MELKHLPFAPVLSIQEPCKLEIKELPSHLRYEFLGENSTLSVIISSSLIGTAEKIAESITGPQSGIGMDYCGHQMYKPLNLHA